MKIKTILAPAICFTLVGCTCTEMSLKRLDQDIPSPLVEKYNSSTNAYVDVEDFFFLPLLLSGNKYVSKTSNGFQGYGNGDLGLILIEGEEYAGFDEHGQLLTYDSKGSLLLGILWCNRNKKVRENETFKTASSSTTLFGAFGCTKSISGQKHMSVFWVPIPVNKVDAK